ncbi:MAG: hypothetical protein LBJ17_04595 [Dysgonamonadaceae bacterium]|nr:hypothetical protein [Dysgonamonadaceae bacterium]
MKKIFLTLVVAFVFCAVGSVSADDKKKEGCSKAKTEQTEGKSSCCKEKKDADKKSSCCKEKKDADKKGSCCKKKAEKK